MYRMAISKERGILELILAFRLDTWLRCRFCCSCFAKEQHLGINAAWEYSLEAEILSGRARSRNESEYTPSRVGSPAPKHQRIKQALHNHSTLTSCACFFRFGAVATGSGMVM